MLATAFLAILFFISSVQGIGNGTFDIENDAFLLNGERFQIISCGIHYFRSPREYWRDRLERVKALGCNSIQTYVPWNFHEPVHKVYDFAGQRDVEAFIRMAAEMDLLVLLRPGPYICAEWDFGGFPAWLLDPSITGGSLLGSLRRDNQTYLKFVDAWWDVLLPRMAPLLHVNGGPIIMVQIENEYGLWKQEKNSSYIQHLKERAQLHLGKEAILYTTDPPFAAALGGLEGPEVLSVVDFGPGSKVQECFDQQAAMNPAGWSPAMCSEYYTGWLTHWGERIANTTADFVSHTLEEILRFNNNTGSVNLYMAHGGTNFGFWAGSTHITSYDYDAPISEAGAPGQPGIGGASKFQAIRQVFENATKVQPPPMPAPPPVQAYGQVPMLGAQLLRDNLAVLSAFPLPVETELPLPMETFGCGSGIIVYETHVPCNIIAGGRLHLVANDHLQLFVHDRLIGKAWRGNPNTFSIPQDICSGNKGHANTSLEVLVQAMGRENFFINGTTEVLSKGVIQPITVEPGQGGKPHVLKHWRVFNLPLNAPGALLPWNDRRPHRKHIPATGTMSFDSLTGGCWRGYNGPGLRTSATTLQPASAALKQPGNDAYARPYISPVTESEPRRSLAMAETAHHEGRLPPVVWDSPLQGWLQQGPAFSRGIFRVEGRPADTFLRTDGWHKGVAWVNGHNLGHYWPVLGPQRTLYVPAPFLQEGDNEIVMLEMELMPPNATVEFVDTPDLRGPLSRI